MCYRVQAGATIQNDINWKQRVAKEEARIDRPGALPDPFAHSLSTILSQAVASTSLTGISGRTPSSICTADPSCIARNKIAELELRLELERVVRLERENELEDQRRRTLVAEGKLKEKADAAKPKEQSRQPTMAAGGGAPGRSDQLAMVG